MWCVLIGQENGKSRLQHTQDGVDEVRDIMLENMNKVDERSEKLGDLEDRADELLEKVDALHYFHLLEVYRLTE